MSEPVAVHLPPTSLVVSRRHALGLAVGALSAAGFGVAFPSTAEAVSYKTVGSVPVRNGPSIRSKVLTTLKSGTIVNVGSQTGGSRLGSGTYANNATWCRLADGRWIHDAHLSTPGNGGRQYLADGMGGYVTFSSTLPRTTPSILGRTRNDAVAWWAETQLGITSYKNYCMAFAWDAWRFGANQPARSYGTANGGWNWAVANPTRVRRGAGTPPRGAIVHWSFGSTGHAAVIGGNGYVVSSYFSSSIGSQISWATVARVTQATGAYRGWWYPL